MKTETKKLVLKKETLRPLDNHQLDAVVGGTTTTTTTSLITIQLTTSMSSSITSYDAALQ